MKRSYQSAGKSPVYLARVAQFDLLCQLLGISLDESLERRYALLYDMAPVVKGKSWGPIRGGNANMYRDKVQLFLSAINEHGSSDDPKRKKLLAQLDLDVFTIDGKKRLLANHTESPTASRNEVLDASDEGEEDLVPGLKFVLAAGLSLLVLDTDDGPQTLAYAPADSVLDEVKICNEGRSVRILLEFQPDQGNEDPTLDADPPESFLRAGFLPLTLVSKSHRKLIAMLPPGSSRIPSTPTGRRAGIALAFRYR